MKTLRKYGLHRQLPDRRDRRLHLMLRAELPSSADLRGPFMAPVWDQGQLGSCSSFALAAAYQFERNRQGLPPLGPANTPSHLFLYWNERDAEGSTASDAGGDLRDGIQSLVTQGVCDESLWPYDDNQDGKNLFEQKPPETCYAAALKDLALQYQSPDQNVTNLKTVLAGGLPIAFGIVVYESFESDAVAQSGIVPMPGAGEEQLGGHAVLLAGYNSDSFLVRNSWGSQWGAEGYFWLPNAYVTDPDLAFDFWAVSQVE